MFLKTGNLAGSVSEVTGFRREASVVRSPQRREHSFLQNGPMARRTAGGLGSSGTKLYTCSLLFLEHSLLAPHKLALPYPSLALSSNISFSGGPPWPSPISGATSPSPLALSWHARSAHPSSFLGLLSASAWRTWAHENRSWLPPDVPAVLRTMLFMNQSLPFVGHLATLRASPVCPEAVLAPFLVPQICLQFAHPRHLRK